MKNVIKLLMISLFALGAMAGCGGGGGATLPAAPTTAVVKVDSQGTLPTGKAIVGVQVTVDIPYGVTVKTNSNGDVLNGVVVPSGAGSLSFTTPPLYVPATSTAKGHLSFVLTSNQTSGFTTGEFVTINCNIASGASPKAADFNVTGFSAVDGTGAALLTLSESYTVELK